MSGVGGRALGAVLVVSAVALSVSCASEPPEATSALDGYRALFESRWGDVDEQTLALRAEEAVAACMGDRGFQYYPDVRATEVTANTWAPDDHAWVSEYGYGITSTDTEEDPSTTVGDEAGVGDSANDAYRAALSEAASVAYYEALYGDEGCHAVGYAKAFPPMTTDAIDDVFAELDREIDEMSTLPAMVRLDEEWAACLADAGHPGLVSPAAARSSIEEAAAGISSMAEVEPGVFETVTDEEAWDTLVEAERELALADLACRDAVDYDGRQSEIAAEIEADFVRRRRQELDAWAAWYEEQLH